MNNVNLLGRIATDLEIKKTQSELSALKFSVVVDRYSNGKKSADFIRCVAWGKTAENIMKYFSKGSIIAVNGNIYTGSYTDRNGTKHYTTDVVVTNFYFTGTKKEQNNSYQNSNGYSNNFGNYSSDKFNGYSEYSGYRY